MNTTREQDEVDELLFYAHCRGIELGFISLAQLEAYYDNPRLLAKLIMEKEFEEEL